MNRARIEIRDVMTNEVLEDMGHICYSNAGMAIQQCETWYRDELRRWLWEENVEAEIVLVNVSDKN